MESLGKVLLIMVPIAIISFLIVFGIGFGLEAMGYRFQKTIVRDDDNTFIVQENPHAIMGPVFYICKFTKQTYEIKKVNLSEYVQFMHTWNKDYKAYTL